jgi:GNAT superfamily N-acetyltransferase
MGLTPVAKGEIATIVTSLEMIERPRPAPLPPSLLRLVQWKAQSPDKYRALFRRVGGPWLWFSRLVMTDVELTAIIHDSDVSVYAVVDPKGIEVGIVELDFRVADQCKLAFIGLVPELAGQGLGRWLMQNALTLAWRKDVKRLCVNTCTLDHPSALGFYQKYGFVPYATAIETFADPRILGVLPQDTAPQVPLLNA